MTGLLEADWTQAEAVGNFVARHRSELAAQLCAWVRIPSVVAG